MTTLAIGSSVTLSVGDGGSFNLSTGGGLASVTVTPTVGAVSVVNLGTLAERRMIGPFAEGASVVVANISCASMDYDYPAGTGLNIAQTVATQSLVSKYGTPNGGMYLGAVAPKRLRRGSYGKRIASWGSALQNSVGTTSFVTGDLPPFADGSTRVLRLDQNAAVSFGQQNPVDGAQSYMPKGQNPGFTAGVWVKNPNTRTLNFVLRLFNVAANKNISWNAAIEPTGASWVFVTLSPTQQISAGGWVFGADAVNYVRVEQKDSAYEGAWAVGEYLLFSNVYIDVAARARFLLTFDDGYSTQCARTPGQSFKVSGTANVTSTLTNTLTTATAHQLIIGEPLVFTETPPTSLLTGLNYYVQTTPSGTTFTLATDYALANVAPTTGFAGTAKYQYGGSQVRSIQELVEGYGFRGSLFIVPLWLGTTGKYGFTGSANSFMAPSDVVSMWNDGWAVGSHSNTHPSSGDNAGLRLLGPYGYFLSNTFDNLPAAYVTGFGITAGTGRRRVTSGTQASPSVFTTENAHSLISNQPIVYTDIAPTGCSLGVTYYVASGQGGSTFTLATDQGTLTALVNNTTAPWSGLSNYRHPGSSNDDSAICADVVAGAEGIRALGISTGYKFFALPQGAWDQYVRSACIRAGIVWVRGIGAAVRTINIGIPSGGGGGAIPSGGWILQQDSIQTDGVVTSAAQDSYVSDLLVQGACGCCYHHALSTANIASIDRLCQNLRAKVDAGSIDVLTCDELAKELGI